MIRQYSVVEIVAISGLPSVWTGSTKPSVGDRATVIEVYSGDPAGYDLECVSSNGETMWAASFGIGDAELKVVSSNT